MNPELSIVIPSHNRPDLLQLCLERVQAYAPPHTEVIVVDDGSHKACVRTVARSFGVTVVRHEQPRGFCIAANRGIAVAKGPFIELLNDDTQVEPAWANHALAAFRDPTVGAVAPLVLQGPSQCPQPRIDSAGDTYDCGGFAQKRGHGQPLSEHFLTPCDVFGASGSSAFYRAELLRRVGGFPEAFGAYFEDVDLAWRIRHAGYRTRYEPRSVVWHRVGSSYRPRRRLLEQQSLNEERVFWRNVPHTWQNLPRHLAVLLAKAVRRTREGTLVPFLMGRLRFLAEIRTVVHHRQQVLQQTAR